MSDDAEFDAFLKREDGLSRRLQGLQQGAPDAALDAAILQRARELMAQESARPAAANDAGESTPAPRLARLSWRWRVPAGIAATVLAGVFARQAYLGGMEYEPAAAPAPAEERALILEQPKAAAPAAPALDAAPPALQVPAPAPTRESKRVLRDAPPPPPPPPATDKSAAMDAYRPAPAPAPAPQASEDVQAVVVTGQRAAMRSAAKLKQNAEEVVDSVVAEEAGKLPDTAWRMKKEAAAREPAQWLAEIEALLDAGKEGDAADEWRRFRLAHPAYPVPQATQDKVKALQK